MQYSRLINTLPSSTLNNQYFICLESAPEPIPWYPPTVTDAIREAKSDAVYFGQVFAALEHMILRQQLPLEGLTFYLTWNLETLPSYGESVVVVLLGDEWCRKPSYYHKVRAVFKPYGTALPYGFLPTVGNFATDVVNLLQFLRISSLQLMWELRHRNNRSIGRSPSPVTNIHAIPLGYFRQLELPIKSMDSRAYDVYFAGSLRGKQPPVWSPKYWLSSPKSLSRHQMFTELTKLAQTHPKLAVQSHSFANFLNSGVPEADDYSHQMMNSRICLIPRGTSYETFRFFEALRYGCVPITEYLPSTWFYDGAPAIRLRSWRELGGTVTALLSDADRLHHQHQQVLAWWQEKCSETAVAQYILHQLMLSHC
jgi:hypothetical protein